jgi:hypothetical protein
MRSSASPELADDDDDDDDEDEPDDLPVSTS